MFNINDYVGLTEIDRYEAMLSALKGIISEQEDNDITKLSNATAVINTFLTRVNWCGFYINNNGVLELGPFQGRPACTKIPFSKGVCGACATSGEVIVVDDVHMFEGHIACDALTNSEIVLPIINKNIVYGVLDIDSEEKGRFSAVEKECLEKVVRILVKNINWENISLIYSKGN